MKYLIIILITLTLSNCDNPVSSDENLIPIVVNYMYYEDGAHGTLSIAADNETLFIFHENDCDTIYVPNTMLVFSWMQGDSYKEEVYPKAWRRYDIYNSIFVQETEEKEK